MKKGVQIGKVYITGDNVVKAYDTHEKEFKLTRYQRGLFLKFSNPDAMLESINKEFGNNKILSEDFFIAVDNDVVFDMLWD